MINEGLLPKFTEFETKYRVNKDDFVIFNDIAINRQDLISYKYVEGPDVFFFKERNSFGRYRVSNEADKYGNYYSQWTIKGKQENSKNNIIRFESNWTTTGTPSDEIYAGAEKMGYKKVGKIQKKCHIYAFEDAIVVFYSVKKENSEKEDHFIEIEVKEETIDRLTENQAWEVIEKYEDVFKETNINARKRLKLSLFDMYSNIEGN
jgi:adenylate cyclase class IV